VAWGFRKSKTLLRGVRLTLGKRGASVSVGRRGARVTANSRGRKNLSLSALGVFWRRKL
jgi:hypothetical protein